MSADNVPKNTRPCKAEIMNNVVCVISPLQGFFLFVVDYIALTDYAVKYHPCRVSFCLLVSGKLLDDYAILYLKSTTPSFNG